MCCTGPFVTPEGSFLIVRTAACQCAQRLYKISCNVITQWLMGHSLSNQQGILGHLSDFDETWCVCSTYGAHHPYQLLAPYTT